MSRIPSDRPPLECFQVTSPVHALKTLAAHGRFVGEPLISSSISLVSHSFGNSYGDPYIGTYEPPSVLFDHVYIEMRVDSRGCQFDRLATLWLGDIEIFRTSTAEPTSYGILWTYVKDMTAYMSLWTQSQKVIFDLGNLINDKYTAPFDVNITAHFFNLDRPCHSLAPADAIVPISSMQSSQDMPSAFVFPESRAQCQVLLPRNTRIAIVTIAATGQADEEFWWSNVPDSALNGLSESNGTKIPARSSFREVQVLIDGEVAGLAWPFPVIFTGGIAPPLHHPMVGLQAFDLREYEVDISPWLGVLCDGDRHTFELKVVAVEESKTEAKFTDASNHWVLSGKIFVWLHSQGSDVTTGPRPEVSILDINYEPHISSDDATNVSYSQTISREFKAEARILSQEGPRNMFWNQNFSMLNSGKFTDPEGLQNVDGSYSGHSSSMYGDKRGLTTAFDYPVKMKSYTNMPDSNDDCDLNIKADLYQGLNLTVLGQTPLGTGLEPFSMNLDISTLSGTSTRACRQGKAQFCQYRGNKPSKGSSEMEQKYKVVGIDAELQENSRETLGPKAQLNAMEGPTLYQRDVKVREGAKDYDSEIVFGETTQD